MNEILTNLFFEKFFNKSDSTQKNSSWIILYKNDDILYKSISSNISNILNTISYMPAEIYLKKKLTVNEFGIPDLTHFTSANDINIDMISECIIHALKYYEKRVENIKIEIEDDNNKKIILLTGKIKGLENNEIFAYKKGLKNK